MGIFLSIDASTIRRLNEFEDENGNNDTDEVEDNYEEGGEDSTFKKVDENVGAVGVNAEKMSVFYSVIYKFLNSAIRSEFKRVEFLTLSGYDLENLKQDVKNAIENKRNFAILHTYQEYLDSQKLVPKGEKKEIQFNQVYVNYGTELYADVAILIQQGKIKELRKLVEPLFKLTKWA